MHGCGNDYIYFDCFKNTVDNPEELAVDLCDRHFGIGGDGIVLIMPSSQAQVRMRMFNADGSEGEMCGNAIRCVGKYAFENELVNTHTVSVETKAGIKTLELNTDENNIVQSVRVDMGAPVFDAAKIPVAAETAFPIILDACGKLYQAYCVSMGNPHAVIFVDDVDEINVLGVGAVLERHRMFPKRANIEFVQVVSPERIKMRVFERGSGETLACGTGACASVVVCSTLGKTRNSVTVELAGGQLQIEYDKTVYMTGPAAYVFRGTI